MNLEKCLAMTKEGSSCKKHAMKNSQYCWIHSFGRVKKVQWYRNATIQAAIIPLMLTLAFAYYSYTKAATKDNQKRMENKIDRILKAVEDYDEDNYDQLIQEYPLGYVYLAYNLKERSITALDRTRPSSDYVIDWSNTRVTELSPTHISVMIPDILFKHTGSALLRTFVGFPREVGKSYRVPIGIPGVRMWFELLVDDREKLICLIGFREEKPTDD